MHTLYEAIFKLKEVSHIFARSGFRNSWPAECQEYYASSDIAAERIFFFTSNQKRVTSIHNEANRPPPTSYATAAVPQKQKQTKVSQARPKPVQNQNDNQIPREQFATMCTSVSSLCKQTCDTIKQQQPILAAILTQLEEQRQETKLARQETKSLQQQMTKLSRAFYDFLPDEQDDDFVSKDDSHDDSNQWLVGNVDTGAVEESKKVDKQEELANSVSSSLLGDTPPHTYIRHTNRGASNGHRASTPTSAAAVVRVKY